MLGESVYILGNTPIFVHVLAGLCVGERELPECRYMRICWCVGVNILLHRKEEPGSVCQLLCCKYCVTDHMSKKYTYDKVDKLIIYLIFYVLNDSNYKS